MFMKNKLLLLPILIIGLIAVIFAVSRFSNQVKPQLQSKNSYTVSYLSQTNDKGSTIVEVTPLLLKAGTKASFTISLTTHLGAPVYDIAAKSMLTDDKGNTYKALSWAGGESGHHVSGVLSFTPILKDAKSVRLTISQIEKIDRIFNWKIN